MRLPRDLLRPVVALAALAGMLCSARLWFSSGRLFPPAPVWLWLPQLPSPLDYAVFGAALGALCGVAAAPRPKRFLQGFLAALGVLALLDQSRWQPWMLQYATILGAMLTAGGARNPSRLLLICTYFYSGLQKLNAGFVVVMQALVRPMFERAGFDAAWLDPSRLWPAAVLLALVECVSGVLLAFPRTRRAALVSLILMHLSLLVWLGPLALSWNYVVWPWNLANIAMLILLFGRREGSTFGELWRSGPYAKAVGVAFGVLPVLTLLGLWDSYLGFSLYSGSIKEAVVYLDPKRIPELPAGVRRYVKTDGVMDIDRWSTEELGVPVYPETRIFVAAGRQVARWLGSGGAVRVIQMGKPHPLTGQRQGTSFDPLTY